MVDKMNVANRTLFIGDNLEILRGINSESVDLIYLDPPRFTEDASEETRQEGAEGVTSYKRVSSLADEIEVRCPGVAQFVEAAKMVHGGPMARYLVHMSIRLLELQRVLKPSGSIYMQSNPRGSHYLKVIMDAIFGQKNFKNEIIWKRPHIPAGGRRWAWIHDTLLFYTGWRKHRWNKILQEHPPEYWTRTYRNVDERGRYSLIRLVKRGRTHDDREDEWRGYDPKTVQGHWEVPISILRREYPDLGDLRFLPTREKLELLHQTHLVHQPSKRSAPRYKVYEDMASDAPLSDILTTVWPIEGKSKERTGWPDQVPEGLLDLIVRASTKGRKVGYDGDVVLDPFCGSGTTCVVAERHGRRWIGIEESDRADKVMATRMKHEWLTGQIHFLRQPPQRTDLADEVHEDIHLNARQAKLDLYDRQAGKCNGCEYELPLHVLKVHRVSPVPRRGPDSLDNLRLLCQFCKAAHGTNYVQDLRADLHVNGIRDLEAIAD